MTSAGTTPDKPAPAPAAPDPTATVLYVCADRGTLMPDLASQRAEEEGRAFAGFQ